MNDRIKELRKTLGLTLEKFGDRIGLKRNSVSQIETGKNSVTEQVIKSICREFDVNEEWLRTGYGDMFNSHTLEEEITEYIQLLFDDLNENDIVAKSVFNFVIQYEKLNDEHKKNIQDLMQTFLDGMKNFENVYPENAKLESSGNLYDQFPDTPEELEKMYPPVDPSEFQGKVE